MPRVASKNLDQLEKALEVLTRVGGKFQGVGDKERYLLVTQDQYQALVDAKVVRPNHAQGGKTDGKKPKKTA